MSEDQLEARAGANFLALDTSSNACSVAVQANGKVVHRHVVEARAHSKIVLPFIVELLQESNIDVADLDAIVFGNGPGSFIGLRIGASVVQGLSFGAGIEIVPISSLAAIAAEAFAASDVEQVAVAQDARMGEVYLGIFLRGESDSPVPINEERIVPADSLILRDGSLSIAGGAWDRYADLLANNRGNVLSQLPISVPDARFLLKLGATAFLEGLGVAPEKLRPAYLRTKVADKPVSRK